MVHKNTLLNLAPQDKRQKQITLGLRDQKKNINFVSFLQALKASMNFTKWKLLFYQ